MCVTHDDGLFPVRVVAHKHIAHLRTATGAVDVAEAVLVYARVADQRADHRVPLVLREATYAAQDLRFGHLSGRTSHAAPSFNTGGCVLECETAAGTAAPRSP